MQYAAFTVPQVLALSLDSKTYPAGVGGGLTALSNQGWTLVTMIPPFRDNHDPAFVFCKGEPTPDYNVVDSVH